MAAVVRLRGDDDSFQSDKDALFGVIKARSFRRGHFTLASGKTSDLYFNLKSTMMDPQGSYLSAKVFLPVIRKLKPDFAGGLELGAVPVLGALASLSWMDHTPLKTFLVRKRAKSHGTMEVIEGLSPPETMSGKNVLIIDDVASTGGSILSAIQSARDVDGVVTHALVLIDREMGSDEALKAHGVELVSIFKESDFR